METGIFQKLVVVRIGMLLALLTLLFGFILGALFGAREANIKQHLNHKAIKVFVSVYKGDADMMKKITGKSWVYLKRAHLHANGLGAVSVGLIIVLMIMPVANLMKLICSIFLGLGALGYSTFWLFAGLKAPGLGSTGAAKDALEFLALPSAGLCIVGVLIVLVLLVMTTFFKCECKCGSSV